MSIRYSSWKITPGNSRSIFAGLIVMILLMTFTSSFILNGSASIPFPPGISPGMPCKTDGLTGVWRQVPFINHPEFGYYPICYINQWVLKSFSRAGSETPVIEGGSKKITLRFGDDNIIRSAGLYRGSDGCNTYGGYYNVKGKEIVFEDPITTYMACSDKRLNEQSRRYGMALKTAKQFDVKGNRLTIICDTDVLNFAK